MLLYVRFVLALFRGICGTIDVRLPLFPHGSSRPIEPHIYMHHFYLQFICLAMTGRKDGPTTTWLR
jgi:hypothetical protein